jgi:hypothetical protein
MPLPAGPTPGGRRVEVVHAGTMPARRRRASTPGTRHGLVIPEESVGTPTSMAGVAS